MSKHEFDCADCGKHKIHNNPNGCGGTGYAVVREDDTDKKVCYDCCGKREVADMKDRGRAVLYLTVTEGKQFVSNWPGTMKLLVRHSRTGRHNIAGSRETVWFRGPDDRPAPGQSRHPGGQWPAFARAPGHDFGRRFDGSRQARSPGCKRDRPKRDRPKRDWESVRLTPPCLTPPCLTPRMRKPDQRGRDGRASKGNGLLNLVVSQLMKPRSMAAAVAITNAQAQTMISAVDCLILPTQGDFFGRLFGRELRLLAVVPKRPES